jgi:hypothetical protein
MMLKRNTLKLTGLLLLVMAIQFAFGQTPTPKPIPKFKPPVVKTYLGDNSGSGTIISVQEGKKIIALPLKVVDAKNNTYPISAYQFSYKRVGITEDDSTGKVSPQSDMVADRFRDTPLSNIWVSTIQDELHSGEELYFFDIVVKDAQGKMFFAPELRLVIQ